MSEMTPAIPTGATTTPKRVWIVGALALIWTDGTSAEVVYEVEEGVRSFFGKTIVRGNTRTGTDRITRLVTWMYGTVGGWTEWRFAP